MTSFIASRTSRRSSSKTPIDLQRLFPNFKSAFVLQFARTQPKDQLTLLFEIGGGPKTLTGFLDALTSEDVVKLQAVYPMHRLIAFVQNNRPAATPTF